MSEFTKLVDAEFNELTTRIMEVVEFESGSVLSVEGSKMLHEVMDVTKQSMKDMVE